jgi:ketosteroid isomerase-like protein
MAAPSPQAIPVAFAAAINSGDLDAALELWSADARIIRPDGTVAGGIEEITEALRGLIENRIRLEITLLGVIAAGDVALAHGVFMLRLEGGQGEPIEHRSSSIVVYRRYADGWRVAIDAPWGLPDGAALGRTPS